ncbi:MAG: HEXXH motif-containing putative peptide modification protein [Pseudomonadota bacterium]
MDRGLPQAMFSFYPSAEQAKRFDAAMQFALRESVLNIAAQAQSVLPEHTLHAVQTWATSDPSARPTSPLGFGAFYDCIHALQTDNFTTANSLFNEIIDAAPASARPRITQLGEDYSPAAARRFQSFFKSEQTDASGFAPCSPQDARRFSNALTIAMDSLAKHCPDLFQEFEAIVREVVLVAPDGSSQDEFEGGTSFKLWGALFLNAQSEATPLELAITLAHEQGHAVLFGMCKDQMLVENSDDERYWSAIRQAKRPLEGIFHATFVSARMAYAAREIRSGSALNRRDRDTAKQAIEQALEIYHDGVPTLAKHARFTSTGHLVFESMTAAMADFTVKA